MYPSLVFSVVVPSIKFYGAIKMKTKFASGHILRSNKERKERPTPTVQRGEKTNRTVFTHFIFQKHLPPQSSSPH